MEFKIEITTDSKDSAIKDKCLSAVNEVLKKDGEYFGAGYATEEPCFRELAMPLVEYLRKNYHPHARIIIEYDGAEVVQGILGEQFTERLQVD